MAKGKKNGNGNGGNGNKKVPGRPKQCDNTPGSRACKGQQARPSMVCKGCQAIRGMSV